MENRTAAPLMLVKKLAGVMASTGWVQKRGQNTAQKYNYAMESDFLDAVRGKLAEVGVFVLSSVEAAQRSDTGKRTSNGTPIFAAEVKTKHTFLDSESGDALEVFSAGWGEDSGDKAIYKAITGSMKYFVSKNFMLPTGDDPENDAEDEKPKRGKTKADAPPKPQNDQGTFEDRIKSGSLVAESPKGVNPPWKIYKIETDGHGEFSTFSSTVFDMAKKAASMNAVVLIHSIPGQKGPKIEEIEFLPQQEAA